VSFPLDYIKKHPKDYEKVGKVHSVFKLTVARRIYELRLQRSKPKLSDLLRMFDKNDPQYKSSVHKRLLKLYSLEDKMSEAD